MDTSRESQNAPSWARWTLVAITLAAGWFRLPGLAAEEPWFDEAFSIILAAQDLPELLRRAIADQTNPPGFYLLLWGWTRLGGFDLGWMRLLPALASLGTIPAVALAARAAGLSWSGGIIAATLAAGSPLLFAMSSELRAYALVALVSALLLAAAAQRRHVAAAVLGLGLVMLHYFGALLVAAVAIGTIWRDRRDARAAVLVGLPAALALGGWLAVVWRAAGAARGVGGNASWIATAGTVRYTSFGGEILAAWGTSLGTVLCLLVLAAALLAAVLRAGRDADLRLAIAAAVAPLLLVVAAELATGRALWVNRYLIVTLPAWFMLLAHGVTILRGQWREAALAALLTWSSLGGIHAERTRVRKTAWSQVARALSAGAPRTICTNESFVALPLRLQALQHGIPLTVLDLADCTAARAPSAMILRPGTERSLARLRTAGATFGSPRDLGTALPETRLVTIRWE